MHQSASTAKNLCKHWSSPTYAYSYTYTIFHCVIHIQDNPFPFLYPTYSEFDISSTCNSSSSNESANIVDACWLGWQEKYHAWNFAQHEKTCMEQHGNTRKYINNAWKMRVFHHFMFCLFFNSYPSIRNFRKQAN